MEKKTLTFTNYDGEDIVVEYVEKVDFKTLSAIPVVVRDVVFSEQLGGYAPQMYDVMLAHAILMAYTDFKSENLDEVYRLVTETDLFTKLIEQLDPDQLASINQWTKDIVEFNKNRDGMDRMVELLKNIQLPVEEEAEEVEETQEDNVVPFTDK